MKSLGVALTVSQKIQIVKLLKAIWQYIKTRSKDPDDYTFCIQKQVVKLTNII